MFLPGRELGGAGMRREERERGWRGMRVPEEGKEAASPRLLLSQGLKRWGLSEANFLRGTRGRKREKKILRREMVGAQPRRGN